MEVPHSGVVLLLLLTDSSNGHKDTEITLHMVLVVHQEETPKGVVMDVRALL